MNDNGHRSRTITLRDVAAAAGVSRQTVSRAINAKPDISAETRTQVMEIVQKLGYRPNSIARGLKTSRTRTIGLVAPDIANPFFAEVVSAASAVADSSGYTVVLCNTAEDPMREWATLLNLQSHQVDGLVLLSSRLSEQELDKAVERWRPLVVVNRRVGRSLAGAGCVLVDDYDGARQAVTHLQQLGHRRIAYVGGLNTSRSYHERLRGYEDRVGESGPHLIVPGAPNVEGGQAAARSVLVRDPGVTALLAYNDLVAIGCIKACRESGRRVPDDCSVLGWDDIEASSYVTPALSTVRLPKQAIGERAMTLLLGLIEDPSAPSTTVVLEGELVVRESTAACCDRVSA